MKTGHAKRDYRLILAGAATAAVLILTAGLLSDGRISMASWAWGQTPEASVEELSDAKDLYGMLDQSRQEYEDGIQLTVDGDEAAGQQRIKAAQDQLLAGAQQCAKMKDCAVSRFFDAIADLRDIEQVTLFKNQTRSGASAPKSTDGGDFGPTSSSDNSLPDISSTPPFFRGKDLCELIDLNEPVKAALNDWLTWMRPNLMTSYENYLYLRAKMAPIYHEAGLPEALLFGIIATETNGKVHAYSRSGAAGPLQFMRGTGRRYGLTVEDGFDLRYDPVASTKANVSYLNEQLAELNQSLEKTLAAYNGGENRLRRLNRQFKNTDFWDSRFYNSLPGETRQYVPRVLAAAWLFLHPEDYNLKFPKYDTETSVLKLKQDTSLDELSVCFGQELGQTDGWFRTLRNLNPRIDAEESIKAGTEIDIPANLGEIYGAKCLRGELVKLARELHEAKYPEMIIYTVRRGDTLGRIASRYRCTSQREIATLNNLRSPRYMIRVGQQLKIPGCN
jgi:membrane-bound lytic murein transglycosylase D